MAVLKTPYTTTRSTSEAPSDLIPKEVSTMIITAIDDDGKEGAYSKIAPRFALSFNATGTRETEDLSTGQGSDIERPVSENYAIEAEVNAYNAMFHAIATGQTIDVGETAVYKETDITTDSSGGYTFTTPPTGIIAIVDTIKGHELQVAEGETPTGMEYIYDSDAGEITVSSDYYSSSLFVIYTEEVSNVMTVKSQETLKASIVKLVCVSKMQSASLGSLWYKVQTISRASLSGDAPEPPTQKDINQNMTYSFKSETPASGEPAYKVDIYPA